MNFNEFAQKFSVGAKKFFLAVWKYIKVARLELIVLAACLAADLITKAIVGASMREGQSIQLIPDFLYFTYVKNTKAAFSSAFGLEKILSDGAIRIVFLIVTVIAVAVFSYFMWRGRGGHRLMRLAFALIIGGALGNFFDRLFLGYVRDFIHFVYFGLDVPLLGTDFAIFNIADAALTVGVVLFAVYFIFLYRDPKKDGAAEKAGADGENVSADGESASAESNEGENTAVDTNAGESDLADSGASGEQKPFAGFDDSFDDGAADAAFGADGSAEQADESK